MKIVFRDFVVAASLESWIDNLQAGGRYAFLRDEARAGSGLSPESVKKALRRSTRCGRLVKLKDYFYAIVPLEYRAAGAPPVSWFIHDLMSAMRLPYYVSLLSAAALHGSSHHAPQVFQVMTERSVRPLVAGRARIQFFTSRYVRDAVVMEVKTPTGVMCVSSPETTAVDLVRFARSAGQLNYVARVIAELAPLLDAARLVAALRVVADVPNAQRLGYVLERMGQPRLATALHNWLRQVPHHLQPLRPGRRMASGHEARRWRLLVDAPIEVEA